MIPKNVLKYGVIIGISGVKGSGKDTVASIINYIYHVGISKATFNEWLMKKESFDITNQDRIIHYGDKLKDCLSIIYNIDRKDFDDRDKKDSLWYSLEEKRYITDEISMYHKYYRIDMDLLYSHSLAHIIGCFDKKLPVIKLRTLLQYFGTEIGRNQLGYNIWVNSTIATAADIAEARQVCIIPDVRFDNEHSAICKSFLYGGDVEVIRSIGDKDDHSSEDINFECSTKIDNNGTKMQLFYKVLSFVQTIKN